MNIFWLTKRRSQQLNKLRRKKNCCFWCWWCCPCFSRFYKVKSSHGLRKKTL
uniref:Uncharacterized protein n=1 Tax=Meloidogyne enterolobii TaxID=390850 RepID=A0A6V7UWT9_MELEN|nr:unnamed protein product [Meloidogyne enterolobii]